MNNLSIKTKTHLISVIPLIIACVLLSGLFMWGHLNDISESLYKRGQETADLLAPASEYGVFSGNHDALSRLAFAASSDPEVVSITITDKERNVLANSNPSINLDKINKGNFMTFSSPIHHSRVVVDDFGVESDEADKQNLERNNSIIGFVNVTMTNKHALKRQQQIIFDGRQEAGRQLRMVRAGVE